MISCASAMSADARSSRARSLAVNVVMRFSRFENREHGPEPALCITQLLVMCRGPCLALALGVGTGPEGRWLLHLALARRSGKPHRATAIIVLSIRVGVNAGVATVPSALEIFRRQPCLLCDPRQHLRPDFVSVVERKHVVWPTVPFERAM